MRCKVATISRSSGAGTQETVAAHGLLYAPADKALGHARVLAGLSQPLRVHFDRLRQAGHGKIPLVRQPVSPTAGFQYAPGTAWS